MTLETHIETFRLYQRLEGLHPPVNAIRYFQEDVVRRGEFADVDTFINAYTIYRLNN